MVKGEVMTKQEGKEYNLKPSDSNLIMYMRRQCDAIMSGLISNIAMDRLGYTVTEKTQFSLSDDYATITITEAEDVKADSGVKAAKEGVQDKANPKDKKGV